MSKPSFKTYVGNDKEIKKETSIKVLWTPIKLEEETKPKPQSKRLGLKSLKEVYKKDRNN